MNRRVESPGAASRRGRGEDEGRAAAMLAQKEMANGPAIGASSSLVV
jgi:hypothetical protein